MFRAICSRNVAGTLTRTIGARHSSFYEPDYLDALKPKQPVYSMVNFQIRGYDFPVLESYQKFLNHAADRMELDVNDGWATPAQKFNVTKLKDRSEIVESQFSLTVYERNIQVENLTAQLYPVFLRVIQAALPEGVTLNVLNHEKQFEEVRYVPDNELKQLKQELTDLGGPLRKRKKK